MYIYQDIRSSWSLARTSIKYCMAVRSQRLFAAIGNLHIILIESHLLYSFSEGYLGGRMSVFPTAKFQTENIVIFI